MFTPSFCRVSAALSHLQRTWKNRLSFLQLWLCPGKSSGAASARAEAGKVEGAERQLYIQYTHTPLRLGAPARPGCSPRPSPVDQAARSQSPRSFRSPGCHRGQSAGVGRGGGVRATARRAGGGAVALSGRALRGLRAGSGGGRGVPPSWGALGGVQRLGVGPYRGLFSQPLESPAVVCEWELPLQGPPGLRGAREASFPGNALCVCVVLESGRHRTCPLNSTMFVLWCLSNSFR